MPPGSVGMRQDHADAHDRGLETPSSGDIRFGAETITHVPVHKRDFGMVFQSLALFPHLSVGDNIAYPLRLRGQSRGAIEARVRELLDLVRLPGVEGRAITQLSGGQRQRVAIARALAVAPRLFLLDEPLSALDAKLREAMQVELRLLQQRLGITTIVVTHDQREAMTMADQVVVMQGGRVLQMDRPIEVYRRPPPLRRRLPRPDQPSGGRARGRGGPVERRRAASGPRPAGAARAPFGPPGGCPPPAGERGADRGRGGVRARHGLGRRGLSPSRRDADRGAGRSWRAVPRSARACRSGSSPARPPSFPPRPHERRAQPRRQRTGRPRLSRTDARRVLRRAVRADDRRVLLPARGRAASTSRS